MLKIIDRLNSFFFIVLLLLMLLIQYNVYIYIQYIYGDTDWIMHVKFVFYYSRAFLFLFLIVFVESHKHAVCISTCIMNLLKSLPHSPCRNCFHILFAIYINFDLLMESLDNKRKKLIRVNQVLFTLHAIDLYTTIVVMYTFA